MLKLGSEVEYDKKITLGDTKYQASHVKIYIWFVCIESSHNHLTNN